MSIIWENYSCTDLTADIVLVAEPVQPLPVVTVEELKCQVQSPDFPNRPYEDPKLLPNPVHKALVEGSLILAGARSR